MFAPPSVAIYRHPTLPDVPWPSQPPPALDVVILVTQLMPGVRTRTLVAHVYKGATPCMNIFDEAGGIWLWDVPMDGIDT